MIIRCPKCNSQRLRFSHLRTPRERLASLVGVRPIRCRQCRTRFVVRTWRLSDLRHARCPKCLRPDLGVWSESHYRVPFYKSLLMFLGANPYRCEYCRYNFISFRRRRQKYSYNRRKPREETEETTSTSTQ